MTPLADHLVGYLSMFLQLGVLVLLTGLAALVRASLGRRAFDAWTFGLAANAAAIAVIAVAAVGRDARVLPQLPAATIVYALLEDVAALAFVAALRRERGVRALPWPLLAALAVAIGATALATLRSPLFFDAYRVHTASFASFLGLAALESLRLRGRRLGARLLTVALVALTLDYLHVPLLTLAGVQFPSQYLGLESYVTMVLDIVLGIGLVVHATDGVRVELEGRNAALAQAERALRDAAYTDALCSVPNRAAFLDRIAQPPAAGTVAMIDLDGLKTINDCFGHAAGDAALEMTARCLRERCREAGTIYRIGGDEFAGIWNAMGPDAVRGMLAACERDLAVLAEDVQTPVRISWGVAAFGPQTPFEDALLAADGELYERRGVSRG